MASTPADLERKVHRLDNDVTSIYEMLSLIQLTQTRHTTRLDEIDTMVAGIDTRLTRVEEKLTRVEDKLTGLDQKMDEILGLLRKR